MFFTIPSHLPIDGAAYWARQFDMCSALNAKTLNSMAKLADLTMHALQDTLANSTTASQHMLSPDNPVIWQQAQLAFDAARAYGRQVVGVACETRTEYTELLQGNIATTSAQIDACLDELAKSMPDAAGGVINVVRAANGNVHKGYDQVMIMSEQAAHAVVDGLDVGPHPFAPAQTAKTGTRATAH